MLSPRFSPAARLRIVRSDHLGPARAASDATKSLLGLRYVATASGHDDPAARVRHQYQRRQQRHPLLLAATNATTTTKTPITPSICSPRPAVEWRQQQVRGKRTKTVVKLDDLPQGLIDAEPLPVEEDDGPAYPTVVLQAKRNMQKFDNCVLLTRVGGFYEMYFEHAQEFGPLLNLKVAQKKTGAGNVPMAGFPFFQLDRFLKILVQDLNRYVAIAEEFPNDASDKVKSGGLMHDRKVARVITPGTLIDENFMDPYTNNYVMAIHLPKGDGVVEEPPAEETDAEVVNAAIKASLSIDNAAASPLGFAWLDLSTGHFVTESSTLGSLSSILSRVCPREIVLAEDVQSRGGDGLLALLAEEKHLTTYSQAQGSWTPADWADVLESEIAPQTLSSFTTDEVQAGSLLLHYVKDRLQGLSMKLQPPVRYETMEVMTIDKNSMRSLEIKQTIRDSGFRGSLLHAIRRTVTKSGARLLNEWLGAPSTSLDVITFRQDLVSRFIDDENLRDRVVLLLRRCHDSQRLVQKFALGRGEPDDLLDLARTIKATEDIVNLLQDAQVDTDAEEDGCLSVMTSRISLDKPLALALRIREAIDEEGLVQQHMQEQDAAGEMIELAQHVVTAEGSQADAAVLPKTAAAASKKKRPTSIREFYSADNDAWIMRPAASRTLARLHAKLSALLEEKAELAEALQARLGAPSLTLRWTPGLGHICHVKGKDMRHAAPTAEDPSIKTVSSSRSTRSFHLPEWTSLGGQLDQARMAIRSEEQRVFRSLRSDVVRALVALRRNAAVLDELDIAAGFARLAADQGLVRPVVNRGTAHAVVGGRHPTVEGGLAEKGRSFAANDCFVGSASHGSLWLITGPNMAGKSTFLRQNALITVLAQIGCFVPASHAELGIVDALFSRVGSADDLFRDQSTFMVEMLETAQILRRATPRSFVIMDEIGRGTTPEDGAAVAFACLDHLVRVNRCRALFATHFHGVADLAVARGLGSDVEMYCTDVEEDGRGSFVYVHRLRKGINRRSHALKVARLAGLPEAAIQVAREILQDDGAT